MCSIFGSGGHKLTKEFIDLAQDGFNHRAVNHTMLVCKTFPVNLFDVEGGRGGSYEAKKKLIFHRAQEEGEINRTYNNNV